VKRRLGFGGFISSAAMVMLSAQAAQAAATQITNVQVNSAASGLEVVLQTSDGERPQVFTVNRGNALIADLVNTELQLPEGNRFEKANPAPGIRSITVAQLDENSVRVTVDGGNTTPVGQVSQGQNGIVLNVSQSTAANRRTQTPQASAEAPPASPPPTQVAQAERSEDVLVPNPQITIDGVPAVEGIPGYAPPLLPRAIAPPLGDISVSNVDSSPAEINLGSAEVVPRLVLRDAPARDVLSLLARAAGLNVAYIDGSSQATDQQPDADPSEVRVSLDIENEPVQNVFNYVLRVASLDANRVGRTIFVAPRSGGGLPDSARDLITRTLRLNQAEATTAATYLATLGAEARQFFEGGEQVVTIRDPETGVVRTVEEPIPPRIEIVRLDPTEGDTQGATILSGLAVTADPRLNSVTLSGEPRKIQIAEAMLAQLDLRQRQVAVNVKIVDVNLLATEDFNTSFSFGEGDFFGVVDRGAAVINVGRTNPPSAQTVNGNTFAPPIIPNPYEDAAPFLDPNNRLTVQDGGGGIVQPNGSFTPTDATFLFPSRPLGNNGNPLNPGITDFDQGDPTIITRDPSTGAITVTQGTQSELETALPSLFQYPQRFLARLQAQIVSGNAKILTDPTLVVQEGETANVNLGQEVVGQVDGEVVPVEGGGQPIVSSTIQKVVAGLQLAVEVERVDDNGFVTLRVQPTVTAPIREVDLSTDLLPNRATLLSVRQVQSGRIRLRDNQTLILSGIIQETDRTTVTKVPILGDIPILGALFRSTNRENGRQEVVALVTPKILDDSDFSNFGYRYVPTREVQEILQRRGVQVP
jgi:type IV pilus assembly protein PilQ